MSLRQRMRQRTGHQSTSHPQSHQKPSAHRGKSRASMGRQHLRSGRVQKSTPTSALLTAHKLVYGDRQRAYGHPTVNHRRTAWLWEAYLRARFGVEIIIDSVDVCYLNCLQKLSRECHKRSFDNKVDICGFAENANMISQ